MKKLIKVAYVRLTPKGKPLKHWKDLLREAGCKVDENDDPFYVDRPKETDAKHLELDKLPKLKAAVESTIEGETLVVPNMGHFGASKIWYWVAEQLVGKRVKIEDVEADTVYDLTKLEEGYKAASEVDAKARAMRTENARRAKAKLGEIGDTFKKLKGKSLERARKMFVDPNYTGKQIADEFKIGTATLYRAMKYRGKPVGRNKAIELHKEGKWLSEK